MKKLHDGPLLGVDVSPSPRGIGIASVIVQHDALLLRKLVPTKAGGVRFLSSVFPLSKS
jgi:hypothetical protein